MPPPALLILLCFTGSARGTGRPLTYNRLIQETHPENGTVAYT